MSKLKFHKDFEMYLKGNDTNITSLVNSDDKGNAVERMNIYRNAYKFRLVDIIFGDFPTIHQILGDEGFSVMAFDYVDKYPSTSFTVRDFGQYMSKFLSESEPYKTHGYLSEIADFEWSKGTVFDAPDTSVLTIEELSKIPVDTWLDAKFTFIPAIKKLVYNYNVPQIWKSINDDSIETEPTKLSHPVSWIMWRQGLNPSWYSLDIDEDWAITAAQKGADFAEICEGLSEWLDEEHIANRAALFVKRWVSEGLIANIKHKTINIIY